MLSSNTSAVSGDANYIEDVFSTYLYTGNGSTQTITNNIDLSTKGGLVWLKKRGAGTGDHHLYDTIRGATKQLLSNGTNGEITRATGLTAFNSNGFSIGAYSEVNGSPDPTVSWSFVKTAKFFDVVTFTTPSSGDITINHSLGSVPGCVIFKRTDAAQSWIVNHRSLSNTEYLILDSNTGLISSGALSVSYSSTTVTYSAGYMTPNAQYVAYIYAHDAGGFGLTGTDNVISCGSFTTNGSGNATVSLGYEPQWVLVKRTDTSGPAWLVFDNMRGLTVSGNCVSLSPNNSNTDTLQSSVPNPNATGFSTAAWSSSATYIYIAIRRGPMKVPTDGTKVFSPNRWTSATASTITTNFPVDLQIGRWMGGADNTLAQDRLRGLNSTTTNSAQPSLSTNDTSAEASQSSANYGFNNTGFLVGSNNTLNGWAVNFRRAPSFFDEVCYTGTGSARTVTHNLAAVPELMIIKDRSAANPWAVYAAPLGATKYLNLSTTDAAGTSSSLWSDTTPTSSVFTVDVSFRVNQSGSNFVAYLFATCPGVSKVGSYTGTGTTKQIDCGFAAGARFVLIKRTDSTGDWYVWDTARGIVSGNDPYLLLNSTAAEVTSTDYIDTYSAGFELSSTAPAALNASGGTYIFLAIA